MDRSRISIKSLIGLLLLLALSGSAEESKTQDLVDLSGTWKIIISNSLTRKQITFNVTQKDGRLRGTMSSKRMEEQRLNGRVEKNNKIKLWGIFEDRTGATTEFEFKGTYEGKIGQETLQGTCEYFRKRYDFVGVRAGQ